MKKEPSTTHVADAADGGMTLPRLVVRTGGTL